ncbi:hypothetical protein BH11PLA2_BH11PLA2_42770 [soil metagenome]
MTLYHHDSAGRVILHAMPVMVTALVILATAYRFYSKFLAAKVACLDDSRVTPANRFHDGQNYHPTNKWVLFGHHFAAISGAGPLIGPVLAIQYGYMPGLIWLIIGVCLAGAVQDMLVMAASVRRDGKSLAEIARAELGRPASIVASLAILFIIVIALAGLGFVVVKALGGEEAKLPKSTRIAVAGYTPLRFEIRTKETHRHLDFQPGCLISYDDGKSYSLRSEAFTIRVPYLDPPSSNIDVTHVRTGLSMDQLIDGRTPTQDDRNDVTNGKDIRASHWVYILPEGCSQLVPGSSWGTFTIAMTIPIALLVGLWMNKLRPGRVVEASLLGGFLVLFATVAGAWIPGSSLERFFSLDRDSTIIALVVYGFIAAVLPVWLLLGPRDYLSSFLKIGTVILLIASVCIANPPLQAPALNETFINGGPTFQGNIFPFVFICVMCGAISGFHALVASGTTPKMIMKESHIRSIGYGAMLCECVVGITALIAAASLPNDLYYDINIAIDRASQFQGQVAEINAKYGQDRMHATGVDSVSHLNLGTVEEKVGGESLRGRTGGAVTLAVGMSIIFEDAFRMCGVTADWLLKYWYHFAIMFEALFILTTIDAGTRIGRFLLQESVGRVWEPFSRPDWLPGAIIASGVITCSWGYLIWGGSIETIWPMFGVANQALAVLAFTLVTTWLVNTGKAKYMWVTVLPMLWVLTTTYTAGTNLVMIRFPDMIEKGLLAKDTSRVFAGRINIAMTMFVMCSVGALVMMAAVRWVAVLSGKVIVRKD